LLPVSSQFGTESGMKVLRFAGGVCVWAATECIPNIRKTTAITQKTASVRQFLRLSEIRFVLSCSNAELFNCRSLNYEYI